MALCHPLPLSLANLVSTISLSQVGEGHGIGNRKVLVNFRKLNPRHVRNAGRLCAVPRISRASRNNRTSGVEVEKKDAGEDTGRSQVEVIERIQEQEEASSSSPAATECVVGEYRENETDGKKRRRRRRTKAEIEADAKLTTVDDFFRALDAIGEGIEEGENSGDSTSRKNSESSDTQSRENLYVSALENGVAKPKAKRNPRSQRKTKVDKGQTEVNETTLSSVSRDDSELRRANVSCNVENDSVGIVARDLYEDAQIESEKKTIINNLGGQKISTRKKRPGRRERGVLLQVVAKASKHDIAVTEPDDEGDAEHTNGSASNHRLPTSDSKDCGDVSHEVLAVKSLRIDDCLDAAVDPPPTITYPEDDLLMDGVPSNHDPQSEGDMMLETELMDQVPNSSHDESQNDVEGAGAVLAGDSVERVSDDTEESIVPLRKSGGKRRRHRKKRVSGEKELGEEEEQIGSVSVELDLEKDSPLEDDEFEPITWCNVQFKVQADLEPNQRLCVVGANPELGGWDLSLALPLLKPQAEETEVLWENIIKVPQGMMLEYKYFVEEVGADRFSVDRKFGPEIQYFIPQLETQNTSVEVIRDTWQPDFPMKLPSLSWGSRWWEQIDSSDLGSFEDDSYPSATSGKEELYSPERNINSNPDQLSEESRSFRAGEIVTGADERTLNGVGKKLGTDEWLKRKIRKKALPREEPWLIESMIMAQRNDTMRKKAEEKEEAKISGVEPAAELEQKKELPPVQVEILINSPQCTMQRMAILEDSKLVELLLEPVNTRVQVGNVYLGVVRQLLPGMSGVFVDIGGFQLALLDITRNQYPYTFPNLCHPNGVLSNGTAPVSFDYDGTCDAETSYDEEDDFSDEGEDPDDVDDESECNHFVEDVLVEDDSGSDSDRDDEKEEVKEGTNRHPIIRSDTSSPGPITVNFGRKLKKWRKLEEGMQIIVQVKKEALGKKGPRLTAFPSLAGRFWVLVPRGRTVGVSRRITGPERRRLRGLAMELLPANFGLTVRTEALGHNREELERDLARLMETWREILDLAGSAAVAAEHETEGAVPVLLHRAMGQTLTIVRDFFNTKVHRMVIDSPQCFQEVTSYLQEVAPNLCERVELYTGAQPIFDFYNLETEIDKFSSKRVNLPNGGYLILEETEALVSIDVNGGTGMLAQDILQGEAILEVNLAAARQIAIEIRLRDIGGIIVVDFIDMEDPSHHKLVYDEMRKSIQRDRSTLNLSEISEFGLMEMTRKRVRPSVTLTISEQCPLCHGLGRVEAHETTLSRIERAVRRLLAGKPKQANLSDSSKWPQFLLRVDPIMGEYLKARKRKRVTQLSASLKVWLSLKIALEFSSSYFQVLEQTRGPHEKRGNGTGHNKGNQQSPGGVPAGGLLSKRVWPGKRRRNFGNQIFNRESRESKESS